MMKQIDLVKITLFLYGIITYLIFLVTFLYAIGFVGNVAVPKSLDSATNTSFVSALFIDLALLGLFAIQHSVMARQGFKRWWLQFIPQPIERSTYVLFSSLALLLLFWQWQPIGGMIWRVDNPVARTIFYTFFALGWMIVLISTFLINHFDLFGLRQVYLHLQGEDYTPLVFKTPALYQYVRHPLYVGWLLAFWMTPTMTVAHLVFAIATTLYILIAIQFEEKDLIAIHGDTYETYRQKVPMLIPRIWAK